MNNMEWALGRDEELSASPSDASKSLSRHRGNGRSRAYHSPSRYAAQSSMSHCRDTSRRNQGPADCLGGIAFTGLSRALLEPITAVANPLPPIQNPSPSFSHRCPHLQPRGRRAFHRLHLDRHSDPDRAAEDGRRGRPAVTACELQPVSAEAQQTARIPDAEGAMLGVVPGDGFEAATHGFCRGERLVEQDLRLRLRCEFRDYEDSADVAGGPRDDTYLGPQQLETCRTAAATCAVTPERQGYSCQHRCAVKRLTRAATLSDRSPGCRTGTRADSRSSSGRPRCAGPAPRWRRRPLLPPAGSSCPGWLRRLGCGPRLSRRSAAS